MSALYLLAQVAGTPIAVPTEEVEAVVRLADVAPVPGMPPHIAGLSALRSRVLTVVDVTALIRGRAGETPERPLAIIANVAGHSYALIVDAVNDICGVPEGELPLRGRIDPAFQPHARGIVEIDGRASLLVGLASFVEVDCASPLAA